MLRAIVFDFDGVIANSEPLHFQAYRDVLAEVCLKRLNNPALGDIFPGYAARPGGFLKSRA